MKQVYTQQKENQIPSVRSYVKAWVLLIGLLVWLVAVKETFGQDCNNKANTGITELSPRQEPVTSSYQPRVAVLGCERSL